MSKKIFLSHFINKLTPGYGGKVGFDCNEASSIKKGRTANSVDLHFNNHSSTHIDFPRHFDDEGKSLNDYPADFWFFQKIHMLKYEAKENEIIDVSNLNLKDVPSDTEFLLIKTGFEKFRMEKVYWNNNPGYAPALGHFLRQKFPLLRAIGFDSISLTSFQNRELGREAHNAFLSPYENRNPILIVEDMHLSELESHPKSLVCSPLLLDEGDGAPVTVIAEL